MIEVNVGSATSVGVVRSLNEDALYAGRWLFAVADGMGGHSAGEIASRLTIDTIAALDDDGIDQDRIVDGLLRANGALLAFADDHPESRDMGTTVTGIALCEAASDPYWVVFNVGDSRVYRWDGHLRQVTTDHSEVEEMVAAGQITREQARHHPGRNVITRAIGQLPPAQADVVVLPVTAGETFLIASDGLTGEVDDEGLATVLAGNAHPQAQAEFLVRLAENAGGRDNISVVIVACVSTGGDRELVRLSTTVPRDLISREQIR